MFIIYKTKIYSATSKRKYKYIIKVNNNVKKKIRWLMKINRKNLHYDLQFFNSIKNPYFLQWHFQSSIIIYMLFQHWSTKNAFKPLFRKYSRISFLIYNTIGLIKKEYNRIYRLLRFTFRKLETTAFIVEWSNMKYGATIFNSKNYPSKSFY